MSSAGDWIARGVPLVALVFGVSACGSDSEGSSSSEPAIVDDLATIPETPADALRIDFPEHVIEAGADVMTCYFSEPTSEEMYVSAAHAYQGSLGHHLLMFKSILSKPAHTVEDCTSDAAMASFLPNIFTSEFAGGDIPPGYAVKVPAGTQLVLQQHYVNSSAKPIRVRDAVILQQTQAANVEHELGFFAMTDVDFELPPSTSTDVVVECTPDEDGLQLLLFGPHMHEWGNRITVEKSSDGGSSWQMIQDVPDWNPAFRDLPPVLRLFDAPQLVNTTDKLRVTCSFDNDLTTPLSFPQEMCAYYGYFLSPSGSSSWICTPP